MIGSSVINPGTLDALAAMARSVPAGDFVEVGVYKGGSAQRLAQVAREGGRRPFLFDTFAGIPCRDPAFDHHREGDFGDTDLELVRQLIPDAIFKVGVFPQTLTPDVGPIAFAHVDCDQYASVRDCCAHLGPRMVPGGVMWFDDPDALHGAMRAMQDVFGDRPRQHACGKWIVEF